MQYSGDTYQRHHLDHQVEGVGVAHHLVEGVGVAHHQAEGEGVGVVHHQVVVGEGVEHRELEVEVVVHRVGQGEGVGCHCQRGLVVASGSPPHLPRSGQ